MDLEDVYGSQVESGFLQNPAGDMTLDEAKDFIKNMAREGENINSFQEEEYIEFGQEHGMDDDEILQWLETASSWIDSR